MSSVPGILSDRQIGDLFSAGRLVSESSLDDDQVQPASLDLRLGQKAWRVRASFLPGDITVAEKLERFALHEFSLNGGTVLEV
ncbi:MAG: 2'-deoxycytidine 5'-triphosphate deaminase, partial [Pseudomonadota bacterium]